MTPAIDLQMLILMLVFLISTFIAVYFLTTATMNQGKGEGIRAVSHELLSAISPLMAAYKPIGLRMLYMMSSKEIHELEKKLSDAGLREDISLAEFNALRLLAASTGAFFGLLSAVAVGINPSLLAMCFLFAMVGWFYPMNWLTAEARSRRQKIFRGLSTTLDVLSISVQAGLEMYEALERVVKIGSEPELDREIDKVLQEINKGGKSLAQAFEDLRDRINMPEITAFCNVMLMAFQLGAGGISGLLAEQAEAIRNERILRAEQTTAELPSKILFPIAVFIFPAVLVTVLGPLGLRAYLEFGGK